MHQGIMHKILSLYTYNEEDRKDLLQEMMLQLWRSYPQFEGRSEFSTWMYKVALNTALLYKRKIDKEIRSTEWARDYLSRQFSEPGNELIISLYMGIDQLGAVDKAIAILYLEQKSYREIEGIMGISKNNVGIRISRIKDKLKKIFEYEQKL